MKNYACIDIGGTSIKHSVIEENFTILTQGERPTEAFLGGAAIMEKTKEIIRNYQKEYEISGICISTAGMVGEDGTIFYANELIPHYTGTPVKKIMEEEFHLPCEVENDVNCAGLAESYSEMGKDSSVLLCLTIGTGIGGCIVINHEVFHGFSNSACAVGYMHMAGRTFQELGAASILVKNVARKKGLPLEEVNGKMIFEEAKNGDTICSQEIDNMVRVLAEGIANICYVLNPQMVVLGGGIMAQKEYLKGRLEKALQEKLIDSVYQNTTLAFAENGNHAGMLGALHHFLNRRKK